jgi:hypothetical protein
MPAMRRATCFLLALGIQACAHGDPFGSGTPTRNGPFAPGTPLRLTYSPGQDLEPAWLPADSGILYVLQQVEYPDDDRCLGVQPAGGGTLRARKCFTRDLAHLSTDALETPAVAASGILAWVEAHGPAGAIQPASAGIRVGNLATVDTGRIVRSLPYFAASGQVHTTATHLGWLGADTLVYVGAEVLYTRACSTCKLDTLVTGRDVVLLDLNDPSGTPTVVPGTTSASSVFPASDRTALYYTLGGDSRVYRRLLASGDTSTVADFDTLGIVRDATVIDSVVIAVVGGQVSYNTNPLFDRLQTDSGGLLVREDLRTGVRSLLGDGSLYYRHPRPSGDGQFVVAQGTVPAGAQEPDLWLLRTQ